MCTCAQAILWKGSAASTYSTASKGATLDAEARRRGLTRECYPGNTPSQQPAGAATRENRMSGEKAHRPVRAPVRSDTDTASRWAVTPAPGGPAKTLPPLPPGETYPTASWPAVDARNLAVTFATTPPPQIRPLPAVGETYSTDLKPEYRIKIWE